MWEGWEEEQEARRRRFRGSMPNPDDERRAPEPPYDDRGYRRYDDRGYDEDRRQTDWAGAAIVFVLLLIGAVVLLVLVSTADFGDRPATSVPRTPGPCAPFCTGQP
ncbi:hypothetical protein [Nocardia sp. NPDC048505]|uniref:hypothetical protein n=1 Tax=unclassified Nocardia TaxID=2637762 RepID=UPI0033E59E11